MTKQEHITTASYAIMKRMDFEALKYSDDMYGNEDQAEDVWEYVEECEQIGQTAWKEKYRGEKLFI